MANLMKFPQTVVTKEITADDIVQLYFLGELSYTAARKELVHEHCFSVGNATEVLDRTRTWS